ncbi:MAG: glycosyltransferase family 4 protein [Clostridiales bacterium]
MYKTRLNIMHFISALLSGGSENMLVTTVKKLNTLNSDINIVVVVMNNLVNEGLKRELEKNCENVFFLERTPSSKKPGYIFELMKIIKKYNIEIIHTHDFGTRIRSILFKILNPKLKVVYTAHTIDLFNNMNSIDKVLHNIFINKSIAISNAVYSEAVNNGINNVVRIYNGVDLKSFIFKNKNDLTNERVNIINVARVTHLIKGQDILIKALKLLKDNNIKIKCLFVGDITGCFEESYKYLLKLVDEMDLQQEVVFTGNIKNVHDLLLRSNLFILPSRVEGFGIAVIEAMISGIPVICSDIDGPTELVKNRETGLVFKSQDHNDLYKKILEIICDLNLYMEIKNNAYKFSKKFDISIMLNKYINLYKELKK